MGDKNHFKKSAESGEEEAEGVSTNWSFKIKQKLCCLGQDVEGRNSSPIGVGIAFWTTNCISQPICKLSEVK